MENEVFESKIVSPFKAIIDKEVVFFNEYHYNTVLHFLNYLKYAGYDLIGRKSTEFAIAVKNMNTVIEEETRETFVQLKFEDHVLEMLSIEQPEKNKDITKEDIENRADESMKVHPEYLKDLVDSIYNILVSE